MGDQDVRRRTIADYWRRMATKEHRGVEDREEPFFFLGNFCHKNDEQQGSLVCVQLNSKEIVSRFGTMPTIGID
jgi:hypothetical protein